MTERNEVVLQKQEDVLRRSMSLLNRMEAVIEARNDVPPPDYQEVPPAECTAQHCSHSHSHSRATTNPDDQLKKQMDECFQLVGVLFMIGYLIYGVVALITD